MRVAGMSLLVTDSSPWVAYFRGEECALLETGLMAGTVGLPALVKVELLGNVMSTRDRKVLEKALESLPVLGIEPEHFLRAARLKADLSEKGISISARDAHVLQVAIDENAILISSDPLFRDIQKSAGVRVQMW
jgi:predicted nucleic acid-binding protein